MHDDMGQRCRPRHQADHEFKITRRDTDVIRNAARAWRRYKSQSLRQDIDGLHDRVVGRPGRRIERLCRKEKKYGKARAMTLLARKIARAVYQMLKRKEPFDGVKFFAS